MLSGNAPLLRVRLTRLADGDILALTLAHAVADGPCMTALASHLGARYRQVVSGEEPAAADLVYPCDRRGFSLSAFGKLSVAPSKVPTLTLAGILRLAATAARHMLWPARCVMAVLHVPRCDVAALKALAAQGELGAERLG